MLNLMSFSPSNFGRYVAQTEQCMDDSNGIDEWTQQPSSSIAITNELRSLMSISTAPPPPPIISSNIPQIITIPPSIIKEDIEPLPFPQHGPGPIQRPNKLICAPTQHLTPSFISNSLQSPETPDVLEQINRLLDHQNSVTTTATITTPITVSSTPINNNSSVPIGDLTTPNIPWTTFSSTEWPSKYESSWPLTNIQSPTVSSTTQVQNPFAFMSTITDQSRQVSNEESSVWSSVLGTATPRIVSSVARTQRASTWNDLFSSAVPSATEPPKPVDNSWLKDWSVPDPSTADGASPNGPRTGTNNPFWSLNTLSNEPVISSTTPTPQASSTAWWPGASSDENNNKSQINPLNDDLTLNRDQSRWDFAR